MWSKVQSFWKGFPQRVSAGLGGPPCETWSRTLEHALCRWWPEGSPRSPHCRKSIGFDSLSFREIRQALVGNQLMFFAIVMMTVLYDVGGCGAMEHPAKPPKDSSASIWCTSIVNMLQRLKGFKLWQLAQGLLGAISAKPTMVLTLNLPSFGV